MASVGMAASAEAKTHVEAEARVELPVEVKVVAQGQTRELLSIVLRQLN